MESITFQSDHFKVTHGATMREAFSRKIIADTGHEEGLVKASVDVKSVLAKDRSWFSSLEERHPECY